MMMQTTIFRTSDRWRALDAAGNVMLLNAPARLRRMTVLQLFQAAVEGGADPAEFRALWQYGEFIKRMEAGLQNGDLAGVHALLATIPVELSEGTLAAVELVIATNTLTAGQANWPEVDADGNPAGEPPEEFTAEWVEGTLAEAGYVWDGNQWIRAE